MVLFTCSCLNVKVNLLGDKKEAQSTLPSSFKGVWFQGEFGVGGIKIVIILFILLIHLLLFNLLID